jgi:hypothetical protein
MTIANGSGQVDQTSQDNEPSSLSPRAFEHRRRCDAAGCRIYVEAASCCFTVLGRSLHLFTLRASFLTAISMVPRYDNSFLKVQIELSCVHFPREY